MATDSQLKWPRLKIDALKAQSAAAVSIGPFGSRMKADCYEATGVPVVRGLNISDTKRLTGEFVFISEEKADEFKSCILKDGDLFFPHRGLIGQVGIMTGSAGRRFVMSSSLMKLTCNTGIVDPLFLFYFFRSPFGRNEILKHTSQVGTPGIGTPLTSLKSVEAPIPPLKMQKAISGLLGDIDDLIDGNRRINELLLKMAGALFQHWFVDFGPFQKRGLQSSPIGPIPKGWRVGRFGDVALTVRSPADPQSLPPGTPYIGLEHMPRGSIALDQWGTANEVNSNKWSFRRGHILFGKLRPYFRKVGVAAVDGVCSTDILVIEPVRPAFFGLVACQASNDDFIRFTDAGSGGTKMPRTSWERLASYPMPIPPEPIVQTFNDEVASLIELMVAHIHESHRLAQTRNYLLPKLLSGEVEVKAVAKEVEAAA